RTRSIASPLRTSTRRFHFRCRSPPRISTLTSCMSDLILRGRSRKRKNRRRNPSLALPSRVKAEQTLPAAQIDDGALERSHVRNHVASAGGAQLIGGVAAGVACAGETVHPHSGSHTGGHADGGILHDDAGPGLDAHFAGGVQQKVRRRFAVADVACRKRIWLEKADQPGAFWTDANS